VALVTGVVSAASAGMVAEGVAKLATLVKLMIVLSKAGYIE
jgi:hypothetical protein